MLLLDNRDVEQILDMESCLEPLEVGYEDLATEWGEAYEGFDSKLPGS